MDHDEYPLDPELAAALTSSNPTPIAPQPRIIQPIPQRLDPRPPQRPSTTGPKFVQPTPQALPNAHAQGSGRSILVSPRQKGNPILSHLKSQPWEYSDAFAADYLLGATTCALFLSLKYHRLHPEYIYNRIKNLQGKYALRLVLTLVDIPAHEEPLKELAKTSLLNNVTVLLCWSAAEGARYLELYKGLEHAPPTGIKGQKKGTYRECMEGFVTVPRGINRSDAISVVSACGSVRGAVNVEPEVLGSLGGWGEVKVRRWTAAVREPFRAGKAKKRTIRDKLSRDAVSKGLSVVDVDAMAGIESQIEDDAAIAAELEEKERREREARKVQERRKSPNPMFVEDDEVVIEDDAAIATEMEEEERRSREKRTAESQAGAEQRRADDGLSGGVAAALAKLRQG